MRALDYARLAAPTRGKLIVPREYRGNMCGSRVPGLPFVEGGPLDPSLVVSWIVFRYTPTDRQRIYATWRAEQQRDVLVSWPDFRNAGYSVSDFVEWCAELVEQGFLPAVMFASKDFDPADVKAILASALPVLQALIAAKVIARACVGWELSLWLSPTQVQQLIDAFDALCRLATLWLYIHLQQGYSQFGQPGEYFAVFWNRNRKKLRGVFHQKVLTQDRGAYRYDSGGIVDVLERFAGNDGVLDSGDGTPFDFIALEITAAQQFGENMTQAEGDAWGRWALETPGVEGPLGLVVVMGSGNGQ